MSTVFDNDEIHVLLLWSTFSNAHLSEMNALYTFQFCNDFFLLKYYIN